MGMGSRPLEPYPGRESALPISISQRISFVVLALLALCPESSFAQNMDGKAALDAATKDAAALLARAKHVMRFGRVGKSVVHCRTVAAAEQNYQSDRTYPPFFSAMEVNEMWFDPQSGVDRVSTQTTYPGGGPFPPQVRLTDATRAFRLAEKTLNPLPATSLHSRYLNPWAVIWDWATAGDARVVGHAPYRDYARIVLARSMPGGEYRLFLDPKSGFPMKLDLEENHYLWGQRHIEYLYTNWTLSGGLMVAGCAFKVAGWQVEISQTTGDAETITRETAPPMSLPEATGQASDALPLFLQPIDPKVAQAGQKTYLLSNPGYTEAVDHVGDPGFLFHARRGEERAD